VSSKVREVHNYTFGFEDYLFQLNQKFFALIKDIYDRCGGLVHIQAERVIGKKLSLIESCLHLWRVSAIRKLLAKCGCYFMSAVDLNLPERAKYILNSRLSFCGNG